jgi:MerR family transcriptional regulator, copper efflux regulator
MVPSRAMSEVMASPVTGPAVATCTSPIAKARNSGSQAHQADRPVPAWGLRCGGIPARASLQNPVARSWPSQNTAGQDRSTCPAADSRGAGRGGDDRAERADGDGGGFCGHRGGSFSPAESLARVFWRAGRVLGWKPSSMWEGRGGARVRIGEVAGRSGVPAKTIRFWEDEHLLPPPDRTPAGYRDYGPAILERLAFIRNSQAAGLTLDHIRQVLDIRDGGQPPCVHVTGLIARRLGEVEARLAELTRARDQLAALAERAAEQDPADCCGYCSIITG